MSILIRGHFEEHANIHGTRRFELPEVISRTKLKTHNKPSKKVSWGVETSTSGSSAML